MATVREDNERDTELEDMMFQSREAEKRRQHELAMLKVSVTTPQRAQTFQRVAIAFSKAFSLPVALVMVTILVMRGKKVPAALESFLAL